MSLRTPTFSNICVTETLPTTGVAIPLTSMKFVKTLGEGGFGQVALYECSRDPKQVFAVKISHPSHTAIQTAEQEIAILEYLSTKGPHKNVVGYHGPVHCIDKVGFRLTFIPGGDLISAMDGKPLPEGECRKIARGVFEGLKYIHQVDLIHRDLKLDNILLDSCGNPVITDFGFAVRIPTRGSGLERQLIEVPEFLGTMYYLSSETIKKRTWTQADDLWSLAVIIYAIAIGSPPFNGDNDTETAALISKKRYKFPKGTEATKRALVSVIQGLFQDREKRIVFADRLPEHIYFTAVETTTTVPMDTLDSMKFLRELGEGMFAKVALYACHDDPKQRFAVKISHNDPVAKELAEYEMETLQLLSEKGPHENIIAYHGRVHRPDIVGFRLKYISGGDLASATESNLLSAEDCREIARGIFNGIRYIHREGFMHRDIKPENILLDSGKTPKIADFGFALPVPTSSDHDRRLIEITGISGTILYLSPETLEQETSTQADDLWSFGVTMHSMTTGMVAFDGDSISETVSLIKARAYTFPPKFEITRKPLADVIRRLLQDRPKRIAFADHLFEHPYFIE